VFGDREQEMGVLWKDRSRKSQHHIRSKNSPCSTVVKERYKKEGEEVRGEHDTDGRSFEKTTGRARPRRLS